MFYKISLLTLLICLCWNSSQALTISITDQDGQAVSNAVVGVSPVAASQQNNASKTHIVDQVNRRFVPAITAIRKGDSIRFPNSDDIRHHVYSFSEALPFELPLYSGEPAAPVQFNGTGKVVLGCNIHDSMQGTIYVLDDEYIQISDGKSASFELNNEADFRISVYHPDAIKDPAITHQAQGHENIQLVVQLQNKDADPDAGLSELEKKFKRLREAR